MAKYKNFVMEQETVDVTMCGIFGGEPDTTRVLRPVFTRYLIVPRCDQCLAWRPPNAAGSRGECRMLSIHSGSLSVRIETEGSFSCVQWHGSDAPVESGKAD